MIRSNLLCNIKLLGDVCYRIITLPEKYCYLKIKSSIKNKLSINFTNGCDNDCTKEYVNIQGDDILALSIR